MQKSLLFLGGSGFIGKSFLSLFVKNEIKNSTIKKITLVSNNVAEIKKIAINSNFKKKIFIKSQNLLNVKDLPYADLIIHAAEYIDPKKILQSYKNQKDIKTLENVFSILKKKKFKNSRILYISSGAVYKNRNIKKKIRLKENSKLQIIENEPTTPAEIYIRNKLIGETFTKNLAIKYNRKTSIVRCFALIGQFLPLKSHYVLGNFLDSILESKPINIFEKSSKNVYRSYLHIDELIDLLIKIAKFSNKSCPVFNLGSDKPISIWELSKFVSKNYKLDFLYPRQNNNKFDFYVPNIDKLKKIFNFRQKFDLKKSISYTLETIKELK